MRADITIFPPDDSALPDGAVPVRAEVRAGGLSDLDIFNGLNALLTVYAFRIVEDAKRMVGSKPEALTKYLDGLIDVAASRHIRRLINEN